MGGYRVGLVDKGDAMELTVEQVEDICEAVGWEYSAVYADYSGRSMYGKVCIGFVYNDNDDVLLLGAALKDLDLQLGYSRGDNMGLSAIIYFPDSTVDVEAWEAAHPEDDGDY
jgi:hypothetical protein